MSSLGGYLDELVDRTFTIIDHDVVGIYLHGSAAMDAFVPSRSDVDVLAVATAAVPAESKEALGAALSATGLPCPGVGLELSVVTSASAGTRSRAPAFELHIGTQEGVVIDGQGHPGDPDLVAHFAMARARGVALLGPPPADVFAAVDRSVLLQSFADDLAWGLEHRLAGYSVLNACRALRTATEGACTPSSKVASGLSKSRSPIRC